MSRDAVYPNNAIVLSRSLVVEVKSGKEKNETFYSVEDWLPHISSVDRLLVLDTATDHGDGLKKFADFQNGTECPLVVICTRKICALSNLISFSALESGFRVFVVIDNENDMISPPILRLTHIGVTVMAKADFEDETQLCASSAL